MTELFVLGAGTPVPTPDRFGTSFVVDVAGEKLMFDCGPAATHKLAKVGINSKEIDRLFFTHHHYDHNVDYPCLMLNRWDQAAGTRPDLMAYGPAPTVRITDALIGEGHGAFWEDINARIQHPGSQQVWQNRGGVLPRPALRVDALDITPGHVVETDSWRLVTSTAKHAQPWLDSIAYRLETPDGAIVFTGDTAPCDSVIDLARNADLLVCMCWDQQDRLVAAGEDHGMCGSRDAAEIANKARVRQMMLVHASKSMDDPDIQQRVFDDVHEIFDGDTVLATELMKVNLQGGRVTGTQTVDLSQAMPTG